MKAAFQARTGDRKFDAADYGVNSPFNVAQVIKYEVESGRGTLKFPFLTDNVRSVVLPTFTLARRDVPGELEHLLPNVKQPINTNVIFDSAVKIVFNKDNLGTVQALIDLLMAMPSTAILLADDVETSDESVIGGCTVMMLLKNNTFSVQYDGDAVILHVVSKNVQYRNVGAEPEINAPSRRTPRVPFESVTPRILL